ncbi:Protein kinase-like domain protein [Moelleriella libera RCEF 2490]|uniref:Protein kinase-like domain protein n=1 Tax=Moelleriella libera RCEF 2490 TaxID=1081109 RepID=A0A167YRS4_9HYPO|nr:Protein kinase-like domain protein [Moelleriella libera RCEF 2490]
MEKTLPNAMDQFQAADALLKYVFSGALGPTNGMGVDYAIMRTTDSAFTFSATLEPPEGTENPLDRYQIEIDRQSGEPSAPKKIEITDEDMQKAILAATGNTIASSRRFTNGGFSISYQVAVMDKPDTIYIIQLRFHGNVASMDAIMKFVRAHNKPGVIPMPAVYSIPGEAEHQKATGLGRQITQFVPGIIADINLTVGPDRHFSLGGPFTSVREWLKARLRHAVASLDRASGIDDYKEEYMTSIQAFVDNRLDQMPQTIEECPIVALHVDMGLHNLIVAEHDYQEINSIIDWELCASAPFLAAYSCLEMLFRRGAPNGFGAEYPQADLLRSAFWDTIPKWKAYWESQSARDFMEWFRFSLFLKPEYCSAKMPKAEKMEFWAENIRVVEGMLKKYGVEER